ncbi:uncharacterized protein [Miscanthus floridulus]|uniref:uncharacterized protein n=1 Tax=Miscanthus floridulus TaxID=154761 RepID=UPI00345AEFC7
MVVVAFHRRRVLPLMVQRQRLFEMTLDEPNDGVRLSTVALSDEEILRRVRETVEGRLRSSGLTLFSDALVTGVPLSGMRDVRASLPPVPKDTERRAVNRAHAEAYKERKDAEEARRKRKNLERDELEKHRWQQRHDGLPMEPSLSPSSMDSSSDDDESEAGWGPLDHLPDVRETVPGASASGLVSPGGGGEDASGLAIARPGAKAPETRALGKRAINPMGSMAEVERATAGAMQPPPQRVEGALESGEGRPAPMDTKAMPPPPPPPLQRMRDTVRKLLCPRSSWKRQADVPVLAPRKALKVSTSSTARWVEEAQAAIQRGTASTKVDPKEPVAQGEATEAATKQAGEEAPTPYEAEALELGEAEAPSIAEATEGEARAPRTSEAEVAEARAPGATEAKATEGALHTGVKCALAVVSSHYIGIDLEAISDDYVVAEDDEEAEEEVVKLVEAAEAPGTALPKLFEEEVVPPAPIADAGDPKF